MLPTIDENNNGYGGPRRSSGVRPPQREIDGGDITDPDVKEPETNDPNATPLGDTPWVLMALLVAGYAIYIARRQRAIQIMGVMGLMGPIGLMGVMGLMGLIGRIRIIGIKQ